LTLPVVRYRLHGIYHDPDGNILTPNRIIAKVSRVEVATQFLSPPPAEMVRELVRLHELTEEQATLAAAIPMAQDITAEADSGGHTDNRAAITLLPTLLGLRARLQAHYQYKTIPRIGAGGGIGEPAAAAAMLSMGAAYILTGTINQACAESGTSPKVRNMLAKAGQADVTMAPAADMFEMGVNVQVLRRGTMFPMRAAKLYELWRTYPSLEALPDSERKHLETKVLQQSIESVWQETCQFFAQRDPAQLTKAEKDLHHRMALVFRWYLGKASHWANKGENGREMDYQVWCGPAIGAFNEWTAQTWLSKPENRYVAEVGMNILYGAAVLLRVQFLASSGYPLTESFRQMVPCPLAQIETLIR
jgi:PfaD family protein